MICSIDDAACVSTPPLLAAAFTSRFCRTTFPVLQGLHLLCPEHPRPPQLGPGKARFLRTVSFSSAVPLLSCLHQQHAALAAPGSPGSPKQLLEPFNMLPRRLASAPSLRRVWRQCKKIMPRAMVAVKSTQCVCQKYTEMRMIVRLSPLMIVTHFGQL